jgi:D-alanine-D-alanine ligase
MENGSKSMNRRPSPRVGVLFGGRSGEHEVSLMSARTVIAALEEAGYTTASIGITTSGRWLVNGDPLKRLADSASAAQGLPQEATNGEDPEADQYLPALLVEGEGQLPALDLIFPVLHGPYGEDGTVQGLLEMASLPYVGSGVMASAVGMDKASSKALFAAAELPQAPYHSFLRRQWQQKPDDLVAQLESALNYPMFVKPANLGSSVGISKAKHRRQLIDAIDLACTYDRKIIVEEGILDAREIEVSVLGNDEPIASVAGEVVPCNEFYDYAAKYLDDRSQLLVPAPIPDDVAEEVRSLAIRAFRVLDCAGLARVDFLLAGDGTLYLNELNTMPGFTHASMYPRLWDASGLPLPQLVQRLVELAQERYEDRKQNRIERN